MTEDEARWHVLERVGASGAAALEKMVELVLAENRSQNLIAPASEAAIWARHVLDSVQLIDLVPDGWRTWLDIGTGGGFPGLALATVREGQFTLVEPRRRRAEFLARAATTLGLSNVRVVTAKVESVTVAADVISARAVTSLEKLLPAARHCATTTTTWILPRGQIGDDELDRLRTNWKGMFHVEPSVTDPRSAIVVATGVAPR